MRDFHFPDTKKAKRKKEKGVRVSLASSSSSSSSSSFFFLLLLLPHPSDFVNKPGVSFSSSSHPSVLQISPLSSSRLRKKERKKERMTRREERSKLIFPEFGHPFLALVPPARKKKCPRTIWRSSLRLSIIS